MFIRKKSKIFLMLGLLTLQTSSIISSEREIDLQQDEENLEESTVLRAPNGHFNNLTADGMTHLKGKLDVEDRVIFFDRLHVKDNVHMDGVLHVDQNIDAERNIICYNTIEAHRNINARNNVTADNSAHFKNNLTVDNNTHMHGNLTVDGRLTAGNLVFTLSSTSVPTFSVCDLSVGCGLNIEPTATISIGGNLSLEGIASINSLVANDLSVADLTVGTSLILDSAANLSIDGFSLSGGSLGLTGDLSVSGSLIAACDLSVGCNLDIGNSSDATHGNINKNGSPFLSNFGLDNTFVGVNSGNFTMTGTNNTGIGAFALAVTTTGGNNVAVGSSALTANGIGVENVAVGMQALNFNTTGDANTAVGFQALLNNTTGTNNIAIGDGAGSALTTSSNNIHIGNSGLLGDSNIIRIGTAGTHTATFISGIRGATTGIPNALTVLIDGNGQLGTISSSKRYKENIEKIDRTWLLERFARIIPVTFSYKQDPESRRTFGMIAEELSDVMPELVIRDKDGNPETIAYHLFTPLLIAVIQNLTERIEKLEKSA